MPPPPTTALWTHRLYQLDALGEVAHEGEGADSLRKPLDLAEAHHEAVLLAELVQGPAITLVAVDELHVVLSGDEPLQELQEVQTQSFLVIPAEFSLVFKHLTISAGLQKNGR